MAGPNVYLNGQIVERGGAVVSVADSGFLHGASVFTTMLAHKGKVFRFDRHLARLMGSVERFKLRTDATAEDLRQATGELLAANELAEAGVRITLSPGAIDGEQPTTLITADPLPEYPAEWYEKGITVVVSSLRQSPVDPTCGSKTGCYFPRVLARQEATAKGAEEALWYTPDNHLAEACFCNVFLVCGGKVCTPPLATPVLAGVVRETVVEICQTAGLGCDADTPLTVQEMLGAEEIFLTASCAGVRPVVRVERHGVGDEKPGPITRQIMSAYGEMLERECGA